MCADATGNTIRRPAVAGQFYPRDPVALREAIEQAFVSPLGPGEFPLLNEGGPRRVMGVVSPHAGYPYSAQGAAWAFREVAVDGRPQATVLLGVNHRGIGAPIALSPDSGWETPLGIAPVATEIGRKLQALDADVVLDARAHASEHSIEVQVPFLQAIFGESLILPLALGHLTFDMVLRLGRALAALAGEYDLLIVASSDFSHYIPHREAEVLDRLALQQIAAVDAAGLIEVVQRRKITMCGVLPVAVMLEAATATGVTTGTILHYHTSGDVTGDRQEVVGYGAAALYR